MKNIWILFQKMHEGDYGQQGTHCSWESLSPASLHPLPPSSTSLFTEVQNHLWREQSEAVFYLFASNVEHIDRQTDGQTVR